MALVVFLRGVNVGGHKAFQPSVFVREMPDFDVVNVGAAGTFVMRKAASQTRVREELSRRLPFKAEVMICTSRDVIDLVSGQPFLKEPSGEAVSWFVSILAKRPPSLPPLPIRQPDGEKWQVKVIRVNGKFALSVHRRLGRSLVYPNEVVEKRLGVSATTRNWNTIAAIYDILKGR